MNITKLKTIRFERYLFAVVMATLMVFVAEFSNNSEIIFPEICALTIGAWISEQQPWNCNKRKFFILTSLASLVGVLVVKFIPFGLIVQTAICFGIIGFMLTVTKTTLIPIISACILPVYLQTKTYIYPISVTVMTLIIITGQWLFEKLSLRPKNQYTPCNFVFKNELTKWIKLLVALILIAFIPFKEHQIYFLAPPLLVTFVEFANPESKLRNKSLNIIFLMTISSFIGCTLRYCMNVYFDIPLSICTIVACIFLFLIFHFIKIKFPPAGAILLIPMILPQKFLLFLPFEVFVGATVVIYTGRILFPTEAKS